MKQHPTMKREHVSKGFIPKHGGYRKLLAYIRAEIIFDATVFFVQRFFDKYDRTIGQMVQAARSGKQNIAEGSLASATSKEMEIHLTNVACASLGELMIDYEDFLRIRKMEIWTPQHKLTKRLKDLNQTPGANYETFKAAVENEDAGISANAIRGLIKATIYLLQRQIERLERDFIENGGIRERMRDARVEYKNKGKAK